MHCYVALSCFLIKDVNEDVYGDMYEDVYPLFKQEAAKKAVQL